MDWNADRDRLHLRGGRRDVVAQIGLRQHHGRLGAALPGQDEVSLDPSQIQVVDQATDEEDDVDVGGDDLLLRRAVLVARGYADERCAPRKHAADDRRPFAAKFEGDPVADGGQLGAVRAVVQKPSRKTRAHLSPLGIDVVGTAVLDGDAAGNVPGLCMLLECLLEVGCEAELRKVENLK